MDKNIDNQKLIRLILKFLLIIFICLFILILVIINKELKITKILGTIIKIISPLFIGIILSYLLNPLVVKFEKKGFKRIYISLILFLIIIVIFLILIYTLVPSLINQINDISNSLPDFIDKINIFINNIISKFSNNSNYKINIKTEIEFIFKKLTNDFKGNCFDIFSSALSSVSCFVLSLFISFYFLLDYNKFKDNMYILLPKKYRRRLKKLFKEINEDLLSFIKGTLFITFIVFILSLLLFSIFKLKAPIFFSLFNAITNIIPYIGPIIGAIPIIFIAFTQSTKIGIFILVSIVIIQSLDNFIFGPIIMEKTMKLHPITILICLLIFEYFFGIIGMCITVPVVAIIKRIILYLDKRYKVFNFDKLKTVESKK